MTKICVFSDSHGHAGNMIAATGLEKPDAVFFLGDGERDVEELADSYPDLPIHAVRGNCDFFSNEKSSLCCRIEDVTIYATHGHMSRVKYEYDLETLTSQAVEAGADIALFGHTHSQQIMHKRGVTLVNPGQAGRGYYPCYAVLTIDGRSFDVDLRTMDVEP